MVVCADVPSEIPHGPLVTFRSSYSIRVGAVTGELSPYQIHSFASALDRFVASWQRMGVVVAPPQVCWV
jgi:hypothetical protein